MSSEALAEIIAYTLQGILEELKGKKFWLAILLILIIVAVLLLYLK